MYINNIKRNIQLFENDESFNIFVNLLCLEIKKLIEINGSLIVISNGGSSAIASHFATDLIKNLSVKVLFNSDHGLLTCFANDFGYEFSTVEYLKRFSKPNDVVVCISSSGASPNILNAAKYAIQNSLKCFGLGGFGVNSNLSDILPLGNTLQIDSKHYNTIETMHLITLLTVCEKMYEIKEFH